MLHWNWLCSVAQQRVLNSHNKKPDNGWQTIIGRIDDRTAKCAGNFVGRRYGHDSAFTMNSQHFA